jgi:hypothetical protein
MATIGGDAVLGELELKTYAVSDYRLDEVVDIEEKGGSRDKLPVEVDPEPVTTQWELWSWYAYYFGNNSAGTLSYAPLSI